MMHGQKNIKLVRVHIPVCGLERVNFKSLVISLQAYFYYEMQRALYFIVHSS